MSLVAIVFLLPAMLYVALSLPVVQRYVCERAEKELSTLLNVDVDIKFVQISPFNRVTLHGVTVADCCGDTALKVERLGAGISIWDYVARRRVVMSYAEVIGLDANIYRETPESTLNIQPIIDALSPKDKTKPPTKFDLRINTVVIRQSSLQYNVRSEALTPDRFNVNHINLTDLRADMMLPQIKNDDFIVQLRRLAFEEKSGLIVDNMTGSFHIEKSGISISHFALDMPQTHLAFGDIRVADEMDIEILRGSYLNPGDFKSIAPMLADLDINVDISTHLRGSINNIAIETFNLETEGTLALELRGKVKGIKSGVDSIQWDMPMGYLKVNAPQLLSKLERVVSIPSNAKEILQRIGTISLRGDANGNLVSGDANVEIEGDKLQMKATSRYHRPISKGKLLVDGSIEIGRMELGDVFGGISDALGQLSAVEGSIDWDLMVGGGLPEGRVDARLDRVVYRGHEIMDLTASIDNAGGLINGTLNVDNGDLLSIDAAATIDISGAIKTMQANIDAKHVDLCITGLANHHEAHDLTMNLTADLRGTNIDDIEGHVVVEEFKFIDNKGRGLRLDNVALTSERGDGEDRLTLKSDIVDGQVTGHYHFRTLAATGREIVARVLPALLGKYPKDDVWWQQAGNCNDLTFEFRVKTLQPLKNVVNLPVELLDDVVLGGALDPHSRTLEVNVDAPYLLQGNKIIEGTQLRASIGAGEGLNDARGVLGFRTSMPTKKGPMTLRLDAEAADNGVDARLGWKIDRERDFSGQINVASQFSRSLYDGGTLQSRINIKRSSVAFNDTIWHIEPAEIMVKDKSVMVDGFRAWHERQFIAIDGTASALPLDTLTIGLQDISLDYVFETLDIPTAMFGGDATGTFYASEVFTPTPKAYTPLLKVKNLTYNYSLMGDADIRSSWNAEKQAVSILAEIFQRNGRKSYVDGEIFPMADSLDLHFDADRIEIGFLLPYMSAFADGISGYATGKARLWGTFKLIDMVGEVYGEEVALTLGFTNTTYTTTDSVRFTPGRINLNNLTIRDKYGKTAKLNGWLTHECFKSPQFNFTVTDAHDLLVYDVKENAEHPWYGKVYGNGGATVSGSPGVVDIGVTMSTAPGTSFTYVLSDALNAQEYNFITFRDRDQAKKDSIAALNAPPTQVLEAQRRLINSDDASSPSDYRMNFNIDITPQALITLVMDPVGGDRIRAHGSGNLLMSYDSGNEDLRMNGTYTLERGNYNFTLQDIIIKDFTINEGSRITFNGDPYAAQLDLTALYHLKANLTDLDESFLEDKELNRTNVPVDAQLIVSGDMRQPEISFDLEFPTLTQDTKRKVKSIINTEEMMNRQIIYLLALNRFYTPDYMNGTRGNELVSVASSTISSQLGNILGQISENWNIAPNFRSDRGDFSDMEFDLALSSNLLNNRLLFNGNLGYRDKSLNNNSFIGDFDIEYLLNRTGSIRLKAYNRYNDQNFYVKNALTTQGVGIVFKRDFDDLCDALRSLLHRKKAKK